MYIMIHLLIVALSVISNQQVQGFETTLLHHDESLGSAFDISRIELDCAPLGKGTAIFKPLDPSCFRTTPLSISKSEFVHYENTASLMSSLGVSAGLSPSFLSLFSIKASLDVVTEKIAGQERQVRGTSLHIFTHSRKDKFDSACESQALDDEFESDFKQLDKTIKYPHDKSSWKKYQHFLDKYGSHYVSEVIYGASIYQHTFAKSSLNYTRFNFSLNACLELAGPVNVGLLGVGACGKFSKEDRRNSRSLDMSSKLVVMGGSDVTRNKLLKSRSRDNIEQLMNEGREFEAPVSYKFQSIPDLLESRFFDTEYINQAANFKSYLEGYLNYDCSYENDKGIELQKFELDTTARSRAYPQYVCTVSNEGCQDNADCRYHFKGCRCSGDTCVQQVTTRALNGKNKTVTKFFHKDKHSDYFSGNCIFSLTRSTLCQCSPSTSSRPKVWSSAKSTAIRKRGNARANARSSARFKY